MPTDFMVSLFHRPGTLAAASGALGEAGVNIEGACAFVCGETGVYHLLVSDAERGRRALIDAGFDVLSERRVSLAQVEHRPGGAAAVLSRIAAMGLSVDLLYLTGDGQIVIAGDDPEGIQRALAEAVGPA
jgi:hypothetical protein